MMKDQKIIDEVITEQKNRISDVFCKFYRLMKSLKRQLDATSANNSRIPSKAKNPQISLKTPTIT